ncbi:MAG: hypothetical protein M3Q46_02020 [Verrucomicrobiota bacterium]|nr:hypothetical protein [Verrucomicrobiota bacterium]
MSRYTDLSSFNPETNGLNAVIDEQLVRLSTGAPALRCRARATQKPTPLALP